MRRARPFLATCSWLWFCSLLTTAASARADVAPGGHFGVNLDGGHPIVGADLRIDVHELSSRVRLDVWAGYSHVFIEDGRDVNLIEADLPFLIQVRTPVVIPYAGPGLGVSLSGDTTLKLNLLGGCLFQVGERFEPFVQLAIRMIQGTYVDLLGGLLVRL